MLKGLNRSLHNGIDKTTHLSRRFRTLLILCICVALLAIVFFAGITMSEEAYAPNFSQKDLSPRWGHIMGTDWLGRDMFSRTIKGLSLSVAIGLPACIFSAGLALALTLLIVAGGKWADSFVTWLIDLVMGVPHIILMILISFMMGKGAKGVIIAVIFTHWTSLSRVLRSEAIEVRSMPYVQISRRMGMSNAHIARRHILPHLFPQLMVGTVLLFPHAILHEAGITFLGFGLPPEQPAIGIILSESMRYLSSGKWWLAFFPGLALLMVVILFDLIGENIRLMIDPHSAHL